MGWVENIVGKGEHAGFQHFLLFPWCFQNASFAGSLKLGIVWKRVNPFPNKPWFWHVCSTSLLKTLWEKEKLLLKRAISPFLTVFSTHLKNFLPFSSNLKLSSANYFSLHQSKTLSFGKGLRKFSFSFHRYKILQAKDNILFNKTKINLCPWYKMVEINNKDITRAPHADANARLWGAWYRIKSLSQKRGTILKKKTKKTQAFWIVFLEGMDCLLDSKHILHVSSKYLQ